MQLELVMFIALEARFAYSPPPEGQTADNNSVRRANSQAFHVNVTF